MGLVIRKFEKADEADFIRFSKEFYSSEAVDHSVPEENFRKTFHECLQGNVYSDGFIFVQDGEAAGYALNAVTWSNEAGGICVWLDEAYILPQYRGRGIGSAYLRFAEKEYGGRAKRLRLEVTPSNTRAAKLYQKLGYEWLDYRQMVKEL